MNTLNNRLICGTWQFSKPEKYGYGEEQIFEVIQEVMKHGVNYFDTSDNYGNGRSELFLKRAQVTNKKEVKIISKVGLTKNGRNGSADHILNSIEKSLERLGRDYLDVYLLHWPDYQVGIEHSWETLLHLKEAKLVKEIGLSNVSHEEIERCHKIGFVDVVQNIYNPFSRGMENDILPYCRLRKITVMGYGALAHGYLRPNTEGSKRTIPNDWRKNLPLYKNENLDFQNANQKISAVCDEYGYPFYQAIIDWLTREEGVDYAIAGWRTKEQVNEFFQYKNVREKDLLLNRISEIVEGLPEGCKITNLTF